MKLSTNLITTKPSFWSGMVRTFDLFGTYEEYNLSALDTYVAWKHDWEALSKDFHHVMGTERLVEGVNRDRAMIHEDYRKVKKSGQATLDFTHG